MDSATRKEKPSALPRADQGAEERIRARKFDLLISQSWPTPFISIGVACLMTFLLWKVQSHLILITWVLLVAMTGIARLLLFREYTQRQPRANRIPRWILINRVTVLLYFSIWGLGGLWIVPADSLVHQLFMAFVLVGLAGGAISVFPADRVSLLIAICCLVGPLSIWMLLQGNTHSIVAGIMCILFLLSAWRASRVLSHTFTENLQLTERLARARTDAEEASEQLSVALSDAREANEAKSRFFDAANHDLRQPIYAARMMVLALEKTRLQGQDSEILHGIQASLETLSNQLDGFLELSRLAASAMPVKKADFRLDDMLQALRFEFTPLAAEKSIQIRLQTPDNVWVHTDRLLLERVVRNLVTNALVHNASCDIQIDVQRSSSDCVLSIADTGKGIPNDKQDQVFDEFYQLQAENADHRQGLGLGLSIVQRLQALLELDMQMESTEGEGTRFLLKLSPATSKTNH
ncbi:MAG: HAMP domain-containing sensor histidine kinase [Pseudomonadota bacterium]